MADKNPSPFPEWLQKLFGDSAKNKPGDPINRLGIIAVAIIGFIALLYLIFSIIFLGKAYPHSYIGGTNFASLTKDQIRDKLTELNSAHQDQPVSIRYDDQEFKVVAADIGWQADLEQTADQLHGYGRSSSWLKSFGQQLVALFSGHQQQLVASYSSDLLSQKLDSLTDGIDQVARDASAKISNGKVVISEPVSGQVVDRDQLSSQLLKEFNTFARSGLTMVIRPSYPKIVASDPVALQQEVDNLGAQSLTLTWAESRKALSKNELKQLIGFSQGQLLEQKAPDGGNQYALRADFTQEAIKIFLSNFDKTIDSPPVDPKLTIVSGLVSVAVASKKGRVVETEVSSAAILAALKSNQTEASLTIVDKEPVISEKNLSSLGIKEMIGRAETSFAGSTANRKINIANGVSILSSALIKPGEEFSTVQNLGTVDDTTGFLPELVIKDNKSVPEFGGGLCQVATTLFRSALNAGLKISARQNHSHRVGYYEPPVGLDATIYLPKPDLKFLNDTPGSILLQGRIEKNKVIFELWGTSDGRSSTLSEPVLSNIVEPTEAVYTDTDTLPLGETKLTEKGHPATTAIIQYSVMRAGQEINHQQFKSVYKVYPPQYLRGTRVDNPPPPA